MIMIIERNVVETQLSNLSKGSIYMRKKAFQNLQTNTIDAWSDEIVCDSNNREVVKLLVKRISSFFSDTTEKMRETSIQYTLNFLEKSDTHVVDDIICYVIPIITERIGQPDALEPSEEIRLLFIKASLVLVERCSENILCSYISEYVNICQYSIADPFHEVKKETCSLSSKLAQKVPRAFHPHGATLLKPLVISLTHQHSRVRAAVVTTIGDIIQHSDNALVDQATGHLAQRLFDQASLVRSAVIQVVGKWLLELIDRYSFFHKLIPLLLTGIVDDIPAISQAALAFWHDCGILYQNENSEELKDEINYPKPIYENYPKDTVRPNLGCRVLMTRNFARIYPALLRDLSDWVPATRCKAASLLPVLLLNIEENVTMHLEQLLTGMFRGCTDEEREVTKGLHKGAQYIGCFVDPSIWTKLILNPISSAATNSAKHLSGTLNVVSGLLEGCDGSKLSPHLPNLLKTFSSQEVLWTMSDEAHLGLLNCVKAICDKDYSIRTNMEINAEGDSTKIEEMRKVNSFLMFLITVTAQAFNPDLNVQCSETFSSIAQYSGVVSTDDLYSIHAIKLIQRLQSNEPIWSSNSPETTIFNHVLLTCPSPIRVKLINIVLPLFKENLQIDRDATTRLKLFTLLSKFVLSYSKDEEIKNNQIDESIERRSQSDFKKVLNAKVPFIIKEMIIPNCTWQAGRTSESIRTTAVSCLWALLKAHVIDRSFLTTSLLDKILTTLISLSDDDTPSTRLIACRALTHLFRLALVPQEYYHSAENESSNSMKVNSQNEKEKSTASTTSIDYLFEEQKFFNIYQDLLRRMDDCNNDVRVATTFMLIEYVNVLKTYGSVTINLYRAHVEDLFKGLLIHLDDPCSKIQESVLTVLTNAAYLNPSLLNEKLNAVKSQHRTLEYCNRLSDFLEKIKL